MKVRFPASCLQSDIDAFERELNQILDASQREVFPLLEHILAAKGKWIRPLLVLSFSRLFTDQPGNSPKLAAAVEYIHSASLVHDDIIDEAEVRRGLKSVHHQWDEKTAVLIGDFLYSRAFELIGTLAMPQVVKIFAAVANRLSAGELKQLNMKGTKGLTKEDDWLYQVIEEKTAVFFAACCEGGVLIAQADEQRQAAGQFGSALGMMFQMRDDLLDYGQVADDGGKNLLQDLSKGKVTLPLLYAYQQGSKQQQAMIHHTLDKPSEQGIRTICQMVNQPQVHARMKSRADQYADQANRLLTNMPAGAIRDSLSSLIERVMRDISLT